MTGSHRILGLGTHPIWQSELLHSISISLLVSGWVHLGQVGHSLVYGLFDHGQVRSMPGWELLLTVDAVPRKVSVLCRLVLAEDAIPQTLHLISMEFACTLAHHDGHKPLADHVCLRFDSLAATLDHKSYVFEPA